MKLLLTGGHLTPALAVIDYIQQNKKNIDLVFVGREYSRVADKQPSQEKLEISKRNIKFFKLHSGKVQGSNPLSVFSAIISFVPALIKSFSILLSEKPSVVLSFGSYLAVPVATAAWILRIPLITHEQTRVAGFSNRLLGQFSTKILISFQESQAFFPKNKTVLTGNPIRSSLFSEKSPKPEWMPTRLTKPLLYVTGGSQGSEIINTTVSRAIQKLARDWTVVHQCGVKSSTRDYLSELSSIKNQLSANSQHRYIIREWLSEEELAWVYANTSLCISRAGANTVQEIALHKTPAIFIPLPFSHHNEQLENAKVLANTGGAIILEQKDLTEHSLIEAISKAEKRLKAMSRKISTASFPKEPAKKIVQIVQSVSK